MPQNASRWQGAWSRRRGRRSESRGPGRAPVHCSGTDPHRGTELAFTDEEAGSGVRYLYTLGKLRGRKRFGPSDAVLGVGSPVVEDGNEPNDTKESSTELVWDLQSNLYYYQSYTGQALTDYDWYSVTVPPRRIANIVIVQDGLNSGEDTYLKFSQEGHSSEEVVNNFSIPITNYTYEKAEYRFLISPNPPDFISSPDQGDGEVVNYNISLDSITSL